MPWYIYSIVAAFSFVGMVLCTRYLGNKGFSSKQILFFLFGFAFFEFLVLNARTLTSIWKFEQFSVFLFVMTIAGVFAVIGNWADFTAVIKAPNPGFVGAIKNSNVLLIVFLSVLMFGSSLSLTKLLGVLLVVGGMILLILEKRNSNTKQIERSFFRWEVLAAIAAVSFAIAVLGVKQASQIGFSSPQINLFLFGFNFLAFTLINRREIKNYFQDTAKLKGFLPIVFLAGTLAFIGNIFNIQGIITAPNAGYHESIKNTQILFTTLLSVPLLGASLSKQKLLGIILVLAGIVILVI